MGFDRRHWHFLRKLTWVNSAIIESSKMHRKSMEMNKNILDMEKLEKFRPAPRSKAYTKLLKPWNSMTKLHVLPDVPEKEVKLDSLKEERYHHCCTCTCQELQYTLKSRKGNGSFIYSILDGILCCEETWSFDLNVHIDAWVWSIHCSGSLCWLKDSFISEG